VGRREDGTVVVDVVAGREIAGDRRGVVAEAAAAGGVIAGVGMAVAGKVIAIAEVGTVAAADAAAAAAAAGEGSRHLAGCSSLGLRVERRREAGCRAGIGLGWEEVGSQT
jgi:hypothetical protein